MRVAVCAALVAFGILPTPRPITAQVPRGTQGEFSGEVRGPGPGARAAVDGYGTFQFGHPLSIRLQLTDSTHRGLTGVELARAGPEMPRPGVYPMVAATRWGDLPAGPAFRVSITLPIHTGRAGGLDDAPGDRCGVLYPADTADGRLTIEAADTLAVRGHFDVKLFRHTLPRLPAGCDTVWVHGRFRATVDTFEGRVAAAVLAGEAREAAAHAARDTAPPEVPRPPCPRSPDGMPCPVPRVTMAAEPPLPPPPPGSAVARMRGDGRAGFAVGELPAPVALDGAARWATERDPADGGARATLRLAFGPDARARVVLRASGPAFRPGAYRLRPAGHAGADVTRPDEPPVVTGDVVATDVGRAKRYVPSGGADSVRIDSVAAGVVFGRLYAIVMRAGPWDPAVLFLRQLVVREVRASFAATAGRVDAAPVERPAQPPKGPRSRR